MASPDFKMKNSIGAEKRSQLNYNEAGKAQKQMDVQAMPIKVLTGAEATAGALVGKGNVCRVFGTAADLVMFADSNPGAIPNSTTQTASQMGATVQSFVATGEFIRTTAAVTRVEVIED
jgi:hypothetical protein